MAAISAPRKRFTREEFLKLGELGFLDRRAELIEGEIIEMPPPGPEHSTATAIILRLLVKSLPSGYHLRDQSPLDLGGNQPQPDLAIVQGEPEEYWKEHPTTAALAIEVSISSLDYDRKIKEPIYAAAGIKEYWIVNMAERQIWAYRQPGAGGYSDIHIYRGDEIVESIAVPDLRFRLQELFG